MTASGDPQFTNETFIGESQVQKHCPPRMFVNMSDVQRTDDTDGSPVGWTILAIGRDGSILCESPTGRRRRYQIECHFDG